MMDFLTVFNNHASAIFGILGTLVGFMGNVLLQNWQQKFEVFKDEAKHYHKEKRNVLTKTLKLISDYEYGSNTLYDFHEDEHGIPTRPVMKEEVYTSHFFNIFEYLHANRFYLDKQTNSLLDKLMDPYHSLILQTKIMHSELSGEDISASTPERPFYQSTVEQFNSLIQHIKLVELEEYKNRMRSK